MQWFSKQSPLTHRHQGRGYTANSQALQLGLNEPPEQGLLLS